MADIWSPLTTSFAVTSQSSPRTGRAIDTIQNHHAASTSLRGVLAIMQPGSGRQVSSNYVVSGKQIIGVVPENRRAWTSGSPSDDDRSITMEIVNSTGAPDWQFAADTIESVIRLNADIAKRYGIPARHAQPGILQHRNLYEWFGRSYPTACAGPSFPINTIIAEVARINSSASSPDAENEEDDDMRIEVFKKVTQGVEWMRTDPGFGPDLKLGQRRTVKLANGKVVVTAPGYQVTTDKATGDSWGRLHMHRTQNAPIELQRDAYIGVQGAAESLALELRGERAYASQKG